MMLCTRNLSITGIAFKWSLKKKVWICGKKAMAEIVIFCTIDMFNYGSTDAEILITTAKYHSKASTFLFLNNWRTR